MEKNLAEMGPELVKRTKNWPSGSRQASDLAKCSNAQRVPTAPKGAPRSTKGSNIQRVPCGHKGASDMPKGTSTSARGPRGTKKVLRGPEGAPCTTKTQKAPGITENEPYLPPKFHKIREVDLVRTNSVVTLRITRYF